MYDLLGGPYGGGGGGGGDSGGGVASIGRVSSARGVIPGLNPNPNPNPNPNLRVRVGLRVTFVHWDVGGGDY